MSFFGSTFEVSNNLNRRGRFPVAVVQHIYALEKIEIHDSSGPS